MSIEDARGSMGQRALRKFVLDDFLGRSAKFVEIV